MNRRNTAILLFTKTLLKEIYQLLRSFLFILAVEFEDKFRA